MSNRSNLMAAGANITGRHLSSLVATGSVQADAIALAADIHYFATVAASTGAILPLGETSQGIEVYNGGANTLTVYPPVGGTINGGSANTGVSLASGAGAAFRYADSLTIWSVLPSGAGSFTNGTFSGTLGVTGATTLSSTLAVAGNVSVNTNKFTVAAASGNTLVAGTLAVTGAATLSSTLASGALTVTGSATISTTLGVTGVTTPTGGIAISSGTPGTVFHAGGMGTVTATDGTDTTPSVTETYIVEVNVPYNCTLTGVSILNGSAVAGNVRISLADNTGTPIAAALTASTATSGTAAYQKIPFAVPYAAVGPAKYFVLLQNNNTSNRYRSFTVGNFGASKKTGEVFGTFTSVTPPTTFTAGQGPICDVY